MATENPQQRLSRRRKLAVFYLAIAASFAILLHISGGKLAEWYWLAVVGFVPLIAAFWLGRRLSVALVALLISQSIIAAHFMGYRLYGSAAVTDSDPFTHPTRIVGLEPPNRARLEDGRTITVRGFHSNLAVDLSDASVAQVLANRPTWSSTSKPPCEAVDDGRLAYAMLRIADYRLPENVKLLAEVTPAPDGEFEVVVRKRIHYWCGNTFFPRWFPKQIPMYKRIDLSEAMVEALLLDGNAPAQFDCILRREIK